MDDSQSLWATLFGLLLKPRLLLQGTVEYFSAWIFTRRWLLWILLLIPAWSLVLGSIALCSMGYAISDLDLAKRYAAWIEEEIPTANLAVSTESSSGAAEAENDGAKSSGEPEEAPTEEQQKTLEEDTANSPEASEDGLVEVGDVTPYGDLLLRRLLQVQNSSSRVTYIVALQQDRKGRVGQARQMMRRIAPVGGGGFSPAHTWLAIDQIRSGKTESEEDRDTLEGDLATGSSWNRFPAELTAVYANLLESRNKIGPALSMLEKASENDSRLSLPLAAMAARHGRDQRKDRATSRIKEEIRAKMEASEETVEDIASLANIFLMEEEPDRALKVINIGLTKDPDSPLLMQLLSNTYLAKYLATAKFTRGQFQVELALLDGALKAYPENPRVGAEVARLMAAGQNAPPELKAALQEQLADGTATAVTHMLLSVGLLSEGNLQEAIPHLRIAIRQAPNNPMALNNLALALARTGTDDLTEASELSDRAVKMAPRNAEYLDTQGEIRSLQGDTLGAVESFEAAIGADRTRKDTRKKLAEAYRKLGMIEMAKIQEAEISKLP
ncbi:MAG: hypothetical protein Aurels2KO_26960 [Aureliella sp.]